ncbi:hypothetical protein RHGRI_018182 [Rhododendron griersonianum]|uniref:Uncharacterized protein n=1 Tax=Rhododendron griersonianum TaxID=479676 RepID=A0AAV6K0H0_9ERIC|nr:hypothetical protein RHGRI_018182 [Rhododendron griersonianum]
MGGKFSALKILESNNSVKANWCNCDPMIAGREEAKKIGRRGRAAVVVLGDIGRSPRMQYHALSLARQASLEVDIVAYGEAVAANPKGFTKYATSLCAFAEAIDSVPHASLNPPSVPTLAAVKFASWLRRSTFIVDWHNFGYTLLALSLGRSSLFVTLYRWFEKHYGKMSNGSLCVTRAMQHELAQNWGIKASVLYDQPPEFFRPTSPEEKHQPYGLGDCTSYGNVVYLIISVEAEIGSTLIQDNHSHFAGMVPMMSTDLKETLFTARFTDDISLKQNRPALIVSSTSWTPDEDFGILLEAAVMYDRRVAAFLNEDDSTGDDILWKEIYDGKQFLYPRLLFIITGKGPEKEKYEEKIRKLHLKRVAFRTMWLSAEDYPLLLGSADLGVCLHTSSSGLDLPMKVVDMFGCGLPVCAVSYSCIEELVKVGKNGLLFSSSSELADELLMLFKGFPDNCNALKSLRNGALEMGSSARWATEWEENAKPLITEASLLFSI